MLLTCLLDQLSDVIQVIVGVRRLAQRNCKVRQMITPVCVDEIKLVAVDFC